MTQDGTTIRGRTRGRLGTLAAAGLVAVGLSVAGCGDPVGLIEGPNLTVVVTQNVAFVTLNGPQTAVMEALYEGTVDVAFDSCIRMESSLGGQTVVWPMGYTLEESGESWAVLDETGAQLGLLGESFTFGGGIVTDVTEALGFSSQDQTILRQECPGRYWIVGEVP